MPRRQKPMGIFQAILCRIVLAVILGMFGVQPDWAVWISLGICALGYIGMRLPQKYTSASASPAGSVATLREARLPLFQEPNSWDINDHTGKAAFPFPKQVVVRALCDAVGSVRGMRITKRNELASRLDI